MSYYLAALRLRCGERVVQGRCPWLNCDRTFGAIPNRRDLEIARHDSLKRLPRLLKIPRQSERLVSRLPGRALKNIENTLAVDRTRYGWIGPAVAVVITQLNYIGG